MKHNVNKIEQMHKIEQIVHKDWVLEASRAAASIDRRALTSRWGQPPVWAHSRKPPGRLEQKLYFSKFILIVFLVFLDIFIQCLQFQLWLIKVCQCAD